MGGRRCIVNGCSSNQFDTGVTFHKLPSNRNFRESWLKACNSPINPTLQPSSSILICSKHFKKVDFQQTKDKNKRLLKQGVVPSLFLKPDVGLHEGKSDTPTSGIENATKDSNTDRAPRGNRNARPSNQSSHSDQAESDLEKQVELKIEAIKAEIAANTTSSGEASNTKSGLDDSKAKSGTRKKKMQVSISSLLGKHHLQKKKKKKTTSKKAKGAIKKKNTKKLKAKKEKLKTKLKTASNYTVGSKVQAQDFIGHWYNADILEIDSEGNEILVRYSKPEAIAATNLTEWIPVASSRIRQYREENANTFAVGDKVMAKWNDSRKFPATIQRVISENLFEVLFDDGYIKTVRANCMNKIKTPKNQSVEYTKPPVATEDFKLPYNVEIPFIPKDGEWCCYWINDSPVGKEGFLDMPHGILNTIVVDDWRLPKGWTKHLYQRTGNYSGKWDTILENSNGKTFRNKNELKSYLESENIVYDPDIYDFCLHKKRAKDIGLVNYTEDYKNKSFVKSSQFNDSTASTSGVKLEGSGGEVLIGSLTVKIVNGLYICPSCEKSFRKETHLQIHVKHYHLDIADLLGDNVPNMQEIASIRTVENDNTPPLFEKPIKTEYKPTQFKAEPESYEAATSTPVLSSNQAVVKMEVDTDKKQKFSPSEPNDMKSPRKLGLKRHITPNNLFSGQISKKKKLSPEVIEKSRLDKSYVNEFGETIKIVRMRKEEVINCICAYAEEDGLMIQCELCLCWQHGFCNGIVKESQVPDKYVCIICRNPERLRVSMRFIHDQDWLYDGKLYSADYHVKSSKTEARNNVLKQYHTLDGNLIEIDSFIHSLDVKLSFVANKLHPKLYLWSKPWEAVNNLKGNSAQLDGFINYKDKKSDNLLTGTPKKSNSQPGSFTQTFVPKEEAIDSSTCQMNLLTHIQRQQTHVFNRLQNIEAQIKDLEFSLNNRKTEKLSTNNSNHFKQLMNDVENIKELCEIEASILSV